MRLEWQLPSYAREYGFEPSDHLPMALVEYGGADVAMLKRMKELETENAHYKQMYAESELKLPNCYRQAMAKSRSAIRATRDSEKNTFRSVLEHCQNLRVV